MNIKMVKSVLREYGAEWLAIRSLYSIKLKIMSVFPWLDRLFEKKAGYPYRLDIFSINIPKIKIFLQQLPNDKKKGLTILADNACEGRIMGFSSIELDYGNPINWQLNPLTGGECRVSKKWYQISDFDPGRGDIKAVWEASRFSHFITLARAYLLTDDKKYYSAFSSQLADWVEKNPYSYGANFKCGQECSLRMVNALLVYTVFHACGLVTDADKKNIETLILRCYRRILSNFFYAYKCIKNNHTISELMGMIIGAWCCGEEDQMSYAYETLDKVINGQFTNDGGYVQHSFNYERLVLQDLEVILSIEDQTRHRLSDKSRKKILAAANFMYQCQDESGDMPNYGSNDGALAFPVTSCEYRDFRPVINTIYTFLSKKRLYKEGMHDEERLWFGKDKDFPIGHKDRESNAFSKAGVFTIRKSNSWAMVVLNDYKSRPAHMDQLHFDLWIDGVNVFCDCGSYSYAADEGRRLMSNAAHNTVRIDGALQMNMYGAFLVYDWTQRGKVKHTDHLFYGKYKSKNGYEHHRTVKVTETGYRIIDQVEASGGYQILFHTPCEVVKSKDSFELKYNGKTLCRMKSSVKGEKKKAVRSLYYLKQDGIIRIGFYSDKKTVVTDIEVAGQEKIRKWSM